MFTVAQTIGRDLPVPVLVGLGLVGRAVELHAHQHPRRGRAHDHRAVVGRQVVFGVGARVVVFIVHQLGGGFVELHLGHHDQRRALHRLAHIACHIGDCDHRRVLAVAQGIDRDLPVAVFVRLGLVDLAIDLQHHPCQRLGLARNRRRVVVGDVVFAVRSGVVVLIVHQLGRAIRRRLGVDHQHGALHRVALVAGRIHRRDHRHVFAVGQLVQADLPFATGVGLGLVHRAVDIHPHQHTRLGRAPQDRRVHRRDAIVLRHSTVLVFRQHPRRLFVRRFGVDLEGHTVHHIADVASGIHHPDARGVHAIAQAIERELPGALGIGLGFVLGAIDLDKNSGFRCGPTGQGRRAVVRQAVVGVDARVVVLIVDEFGTQHRCVRPRGDDREAFTLGFSLVAGKIRGRDQRGVLAIGQIGIDLQTPVAVVVGFGFEDSPIEFDPHQGQGLGLTFEHRTRVGRQAVFAVDARVVVLVMNEVAAGIVHLRVDDDLGAFGFGHVAGGIDHAKDGRIDPIAQTVGHHLPTAGRIDIALIAVLRAIDLDDDAQPRVDQTVVVERHGTSKHRAVVAGHTVLGIDARVVGRVANQIVFVEVRSRQIHRERGRSLLRDVACGIDVLDLDHIATFVEFVVLVDRRTPVAVHGHQRVAPEHLTVVQAFDLEQHRGIGFHRANEGGQGVHREPIFRRQAGIDLLLLKQTCRGVHLGGHRVDHEGQHVFGLGGPTGPVDDGHRRGVLTVLQRLGERDLPLALVIGHRAQHDIVEGDHDMGARLSTPGQRRSDHLGHAIAWQTGIAVQPGGVPGLPVKCHGGQSRRHVVDDQGVHGCRRADVACGIHHRDPRHVAAIGQGRGDGQRPGSIGSDLSSGHHVADARQLERDTHHARFGLATEHRGAVGRDVVGKGFFQADDVVVARIAAFGTGLFVSRLQAQLPGIRLAVQGEFDARHGRHGQRRSRRHDLPRVDHLVAVLGQRQFGAPVVLVAHAVFDHRAGLEIAHDKLGVRRDGVGGRSAGVGLQPKGRSRQGGRVVGEGERFGRRRQQTIAVGQAHLNGHLPPARWHQVGTPRDTAIEGVLDLRPGIHASHHEPRIARDPVRITDPGVGHQPDDDRHGARELGVGHAPRPGTVVDVGIVGRDVRDLMQHVRRQRCGPALAEDGLENVSVREVDDIVASDRVAAQDLDVAGQAIEGRARKRLDTGHVRDLGGDLEHGQTHSLTGLSHLDGVEGRQVDRRVEIEGRQHTVLGRLHGESTAIHQGRHEGGQGVHHHLAHIPPSPSQQAQRHGVGQAGVDIGATRDLDVTHQRGVGQHDAPLRIGRAHHRATAAGLDHRHGCVANQSVVHGDDKAVVHPPVVHGRGRCATAPPTATATAAQAGTETATEQGQHVVATAQQGGGQIQFLPSPTQRCPVRGRTGQRQRRGRSVSQDHVHGREIARQRRHLTACNGGFGGRRRCEFRDACGSLLCRQRR